MEKEQFTALTLSREPKHMKNNSTFIKISNESYDYHRHAFAKIHELNSVLYMGKDLETKAQLKQMAQCCESIQQSICNLQTEIDKAIQSGNEIEWLAETGIFEKREAQN